MADPIEEDWSAVQGKTIMAERQWVREDARVERRVQHRRELLSLFFQNIAWVWKEFVRRFGDGSLIAMVLCGFGAYTLYEILIADGRVDYCYIDTKTGDSRHFKLWGHRAWRSDTELGQVEIEKEPQPISLIELAGKLKCPLHR